MATGRISFSPRPFQATPEQVQEGEEAYRVVTPATLAGLLYAEAVAGAQVLAFRLVASLGGQILHADPTDVDHAARVCGLTLTSAMGGEVARITPGGDVTNPGWSFTPSTPLWLGPDGTLTETIPVVPAAAFSLPVGIAIAPDRVALRLGAPLILTSET